MSWTTLASGFYASKPCNIEGSVYVVNGLQSVKELLQHKSAEPYIIVTNLAGGSAILTLLQRAKAIVSTAGGPNSHIVVIAKDNDIPCIVGVSEINLSTLSNGLKIRLRSDGGIDIYNTEQIIITKSQSSILRKIAFSGAVSSVNDIHGCPLDVLEAALPELIKIGVIDNYGFYQLTPNGTALLEAQYTKDRALLNETNRSGLNNNFRLLDDELKKLARQWQETRKPLTSMPTEILSTLSGLHKQILNYFQKYQSVIPRFIEYRNQLENAYALINEGDQRYFVSTKLDSYHTIWCQLHEDLLRLLQRERDTL